VSIPKELCYRWENTKRYVANGSFFLLKAPHLRQAQEPEKSRLLCFGFKKASVRTEAGAEGNFQNIQPLAFPYNPEYCNQEFIKNLWL
jgi:hypothetical protein